MAISAVVAAVSTTTAAFSGTLMFSSIAAHFFISTALGSALRFLSGEIAPDGGTGQGGYSISGDSGAALDYQIIYGEAKAGGVRVYDSTTGSSNKYLHRILVFAGHEIDSYQKIYVDDEEVTLNGSGVVTAPTKYANLIRIKRYYGTSGQTADADLISDTASLTNGKWTVDHRLQGLAYLYIRFEYSETAYPNGVPTVSALIRGKKVYDPRVPTTAWSNNPALCWRDYMTDVVYGMKVSTSRIDDTFVTTAANQCDELVSGKKRYTCDGKFLTNREPGSVISDLVSSMAGSAYYASGKWKCRAGNFISSSLSLSEKDIRSTVSVTSRYPRSQVFNKVKGVYAGDATDWEFTDYPEVSDPAYLTVDGNFENTLDLPLPFTSDAAICQRVANVVLRRNREQITLSARFGLRALQAEVSDTVSLTIARYGWTNKLFEVTSWRLVTTEDRNIFVQMELREISSAVFTNANPAVFESNNTTLQSAFEGLVVSGLSATVVAEAQKDGTFLMSAEIDWTVDVPSMVDFYRVQWKPTSQNKYTQTTCTDSEFRIHGIRDLVQYTVRVQAVNKHGVAGSWVSTTFTNNGDVTAPPAPTNVRAVPVSRGVQLVWDNPTSSDFKNIRVWENTTNTFTGATRIATVATDHYLRQDLKPNALRYYFLQSVDQSGNVSSATAGVGARALGNMNQINLVPDEDMQDPNGWTGTTGGSPNYSLVDDGGPTSGVSRGELRYVGTLPVSTNKDSDSDEFSVVAGDTLLCSCITRSDATGTTYTASLLVVFYDNAGSQISVATVGTVTTTATSVQTIKDVVVVPANAQKARTRFRYSSGSRNVCFSSPVVYRAQKTENIEKNAVTTNNYAKSTSTFSITSSASDTTVSKNRVTKEADIPVMFICSLSISAYGTGTAMVSIWRGGTKLKERPFTTAERGSASEMCFIESDDSKSAGTFDYTLRVRKAGKESGMNADLVVKRPNFFILSNKR